MAFPNFPPKTPAVGVKTPAGGAAVKTPRGTAVKVPAKPFPFAPKKK